MNQGEWIMNLISDYKKELNEKKINLDDDFIKFIRFAQWKLERTGQGIFAMITSNTFIDGITHRQMRRSLMDTFDEIYIYNLHGNLRKHEISPDGSIDENVFEKKIQSGVSINTFIKYPKRLPQPKIYIADIWGTYKYKWSKLLEQNFSQIKWTQVDVEGFNEKFKSTRWGKNFGGDLNFFVQKESELMVEYGNFYGLTEIFPTFNSGIITRNDKITIQFDRNSMEILINDFINLEVDDLRSKYTIEDGASWKLINAKKDVITNQKSNVITDILYRPFDTRFTLFTKKSGGFLNRPIHDLMRNLTKPNLALLSKRQSVLDFSYIFVTNIICESCVFESAYANNSVFPLYLYPDNEENQMDFINNHNRRANLAQEFINLFSENLSLKYIADGRGDLDSTFGPEDIFYYSYAIYNSTIYRNRYAEQLKIDFPRLPIISDRLLFKKLVNQGNELVNLHLVGENPFDSSITILSDPSKWGIQIAGENLRDSTDWGVTEVHYDQNTKRVYINSGQYFTGVDLDIWNFFIGGYQVLDKWLKERKKANRHLSTDDIKHFIKIVVILRETIRIQKEIDATGFMEKL